MLKYADNNYRNYAFDFAKKNGYEYFHNNLEAEECTIHYNSIDEYGVILGYFAAHIYDNICWSLEFIAYEYNREYFKDAKIFIEILKKLCKGIDLEININSPAFKMCNTLFMRNKGKMKKKNQYAKFEWRDEDGKSES
ncbi:MAG: hypothetical protein ACRCZH_02150 [Cetobacterium sp.]